MSNEIVSTGDARSGGYKEGGRWKTSCELSQEMERETDRDRDLGSKQDGPLNFLGMHESQ